MNRFMEIIRATPQEMAPAIQTAQSLAVSLLIAFGLSLLLMLCYRLCHDRLTYHRTFNLMLMMLALASTLLLTLIQDNPILALGSLGAMSICRIRTNTRDPRDLGFVFWSLTIGISSAMGEYLVGLLGTVSIGLVMLIFTKCQRRQNKEVLVIRGRKEQVPQVQELFRTVKGSTMESENMFPDSFELVYALKIPKAEQEALLLRLNHMDGIDGVNLLAPETEVL